MPDNTEICGSTDTKSGEPCGTPARLCQWHDSGTPPDNGRPSILDDHWEDILHAARQGMTLEGCARLAGVDESTLHRWINKHSDFRKSIKRARAEGELQHLQRVNDKGSRFILERSFGYVKTEKREIDAEHEHTVASIPSDDQLDDLLVDLDQWE